MAASITRHARVLQRETARLCSLIHLQDTSDDTRTMLRDVVKELNYLYDELYDAAGVDPRTGKVK